MTIRLEDWEKNLLIKYAKKTGRTQTEILREFIRSLETKGEK